MTKKDLSLIGLVLILGCLYVYFFTDLFAPKIIRIEHSVRPFPAGVRGQAAPTAKNASVVSFALHREFKLTRVQVVPLAEALTNKYAHPIWELVADKKTAPTKGFVYGGFIEGMHSAVPNAIADTLDPHVEYRLLIEAGSYKGQHDFTVAKAMEAPQQ